MKLSGHHPPMQAWSGDVRVKSGIVELNGSVDVPADARGLVLFAHGSGSSRLSPRNRRVAQTLQRAQLATVLFDLLTRDEEAEDALTGHLRFDIEFLASRLRVATDWATGHEHTGR